MINSLLIKLATTQVPKLARHLLVFIGAWMAAKGFEGDINAPVEFITGLIVIAAGFGWSVWMKTPVNPAWSDLIRKAAEVGARKLVSVLAAIMVAKGAPASDDHTTAGLIIIAANWLASVLTEPKPKVKQ